MGLQQNIQMMGVTSTQGNAVFVRREVNPVLQVRVKNFAVMFNLDVSGSMSGNKWSNVCSSVGTFISKLGESDLVSGLVFNNEVKLLSNIKEDDKLFQRPRSNSNAVKAVTNANNTKVNFYVTQTTKKEDDCNIM